MLDTQVTIRILNTSKKPTWSKQSVNLKITKGVLKWVNFRHDNECKLLGQIYSKHNEM